MVIEGLNTLGLAISSDGIVPCKDAARLVLIAVLDRESVLDVLVELGDPVLPSNAGIDGVLFVEDGNTSQVGIVTASVEFEAALAAKNQKRTKSKFKLR